MTEPLPIPASAIEAADEAMYAQYSGPEKRRRLPTIEKALRAAFEELGMRKQTLKEEGGIADYDRLVSRWMPVEEPSKIPDKSDMASKRVPYTES